MTSIIKKTLLISALTLGVFLVIIFAFGNLAPLNTVIAQKAPAMRLESLSSLPQVTSLSKTNVTKEIASDIAQELLKKNPNGPVSGPDNNALATIDPNELTQQVLERAFREIKTDDLRPEVKASDLIIIQSSEPKTEEAYFNTVRKILAENFPSTLDVNKIDPAKTDFGAFDSAFSQSIKELRQTPTPSALLSFQINTISLLGALRNVFTLIKNYQNDPFQAALAVELGNEFGAELMQVFVDINGYMRTHNLHFVS